MVSFGLHRFFYTTSRYSTDGALTTQPRTRAVLPVRNASASAMQSPPASAEATSVITLSPGWARPGATQVQVPVNQFGQARMPAQRGWQDQPSIGHQAVVVKGDLDAVGVVIG